MRLLILMTVVTGVLLSGCGRKTDGEQAKKKEKSTAQTMIDGMTGRTAVRAGQKAKKTIESAAAKKNEDLGEIYGE